MIYKYKFVILFIFILSVFLVPFQNCSKIPITAMSRPPDPTPIAKMDITAQSCVNAKSLLPEKTKFVFIIDLSRSNLGEFFNDDYLFNGNLTTGKKYKFFDTNLGTDPDGKRFDTLKNFIETCGSQDADTEYSIIGFSDAAGVVKTSGSSKIFQCEPQFYHNTTAIQKIDELKAVAQAEKTVYASFKKPTKPLLSVNKAEIDPLLSKQTNYVAATECLSQTIENDLMTSNAAINYQVFFVSDGAAVAKSTGCEETTVADKIKCYTDKMDESLNYTMKLASALLKNIRIHAIYYTKSGERDSIIESYMKYLSSVGQTRDPINLGNVADAAAAGKNPFCDLLSVDKSIIYKTNSIVGINTNRIQIGPVLKLDTDADGITDDLEESVYFSDPTNARSMVPGVLDGICKILGGREACLTEKEKISCNASLMNQFNMSDCDVRILKLEQFSINPNLAGIDSDNDNIPDYVEILKGLNPMTADSNQDTDSDGLTNLEEISTGRDPFVPDQNMAPLLSFNLSFSDTIQGCDNGGWTYNLNSLTTTEGHNEILLYFKTISQNSVNSSEFKNFVLNYNFSKDSKSKSMLLSDLGSQLIRPVDFTLVEKKVSTP
jgi:hypothetical protein